MELKEVKIEDIRLSGMNPRKTIDEAGIRELAENIRKQGLIQPITVRPIIQDEVVDDEVLSLIIGYELVCGERRLKAVQQLGRKKIACYVKDMTDDEAFDAMITENLQRQDVDPMEEAFAFMQLNARGQSAEDIALRFGKSARFVQDRIKLNGLIDDMKEALKEGRLPIAGALMLAKLDKEQQEAFYHDRLSVDDWSVNKKEVAHWIDGLFLRIDRAPWYEDDCMEDYKPCLSCEFNTSNQGCLFYEMKGESPKCTCRECYGQKSMAYILWKVEHSPKPFLKDGEGDIVTALKKKGRRVLMAGNSYREDGLGAKLVAQLKEKGYTVLSSDKFSRCWYERSDECLQKLIDEGEVFEAVAITSYYDIMWKEECYWYPKDTTAKKGAASFVQDQTSPLINKYRRNEELVSEKRFDSFKDRMLDAKLYDRGGELTETERKAFDMMLFDSLSYTVRRGICENGSTAEFYKLLQSGGYDREKIFRMFIAEKVRSLYGESRGILDTLMEEYIPEEFAEFRTKLEATYAKRQEKIRAQLAELGYDVDGKKIEKP